MDGTAGVTVAVTVIRDSEVMADESYEVLYSARPLDREGLRQSLDMSIHAQNILEGLELEAGDLVTAQTRSRTEVYLVNFAFNSTVELIDP